MMNTSQPSNPPSASLRGPKILNSRRPLQTRSVNTSSSQSPAKTKTSRTKLSALKSRMEPQPKLSVVSENVNEWSSFIESRTPSLESESVERAAQRPAIFRRSRSDLDDEEEDMFVLKRANPVYDSDDEDYMASPAKRQRTGEPTVLDWGARLSENEVDGFTLGL